MHLVCVLVILLLFGGVFGFEALGFFGRPKGNLEEKLECCEYRI